MDARPDDDALLQRAEEIAAQLMHVARSFEDRADRVRRKRIAALVGDPSSREFLAELTDQVLRISDGRRSARRLRDLLDERGTPSFATGLDRLGLEMAGHLAPVAPRLVMPVVRARLGRELRGIILPAERRAYARHARRRRRQGIRLNANLLGEAILGERQASDRVRAVVDLLARPEIDYVSVKISSICAQLDVLAYDDEVARIAGQLAPIYRAAVRARPAKFVNLDVEEYRDLHLTIDAFEQALADPELDGLDAGIVLQAYLPDSYAALEELTEFARRRHERGGGTVKVRLVKGANLAMERVDAELRDWPQAPFGSKAEVDASFKRLLDLAVARQGAGALRVGVASHNVFDIGWALALREATGAAIELEMLEGMANPQALAARRIAGEMLLYAPIVARGDFGAAVAYLVRRFDENTSPENFLSHLFDLDVGSPSWSEQRDRFRSSVRARLEPPPPPRRLQDRGARDTISSGSAQSFANEPDTDFSLARNRAWLAAALEELASEPLGEVAAVVDGEEVLAPMTGRGENPFVPGETLYRYVESDVATVDRAVDVARRSASGWRDLGARERGRILRAVAQVMARERGHTLAVMARDAGKTVGEGDPEVSEAIDFARFYADRALELESPHCATFEPYRTVAVVPPWNFPYAIPAGGVLAALAAGSAVVLKPAPESVLTAAQLARQCWAGGVPKDVLQFVPCADGEAGKRLVSHPGVDAVIFTGAFETARMFLSWRPSLALHGETSGKNAVVITAAADEEDAIRDLVRSAFGHAGQKCSAASLAIVEAPLYDSQRFRTRLADTVRSLRVGRADDLATQVGPLIRAPQGALRGALSELEPGEEWLVAPTQVGAVATAWRPGVKLGVRPGSPFHLTECFGPVLGLMRARDLEHAIELQNATDYGLTAGLQTLDPAEVAVWSERVEAGNLYVNRVTTGAVVRRQPFGGWKRSSVGAVAKAGGPHYVASLGRWRAVGGARPDLELEAAMGLWKMLSEGEDPTGLRVERNVFRLRVVPAVSLRLGTGRRDQAARDCGAPDEDGLGGDEVGAGVDRGALELALAIADRLGVALDISVDPAVPGAPPSATAEREEAFLARIAARRVDRVRLCGSSGKLRLAALDAGFEVDTAELSPVGSVELLHWTREQVVSETLHRHGLLSGPSRA